jgi:hypothetical protein
MQPEAAVVAPRLLRENDLLIGELLVVNRLIIRLGQQAFQL